MRSKHTILDVLFPKVRAEILRLLFMAPKEQRYVRQLTSLSGLALCTVQDELRKLSAIGLVTSWSNGYHRFCQANRNHPLFSELLRIVQMSIQLPQPKRSILHRQRRSHSRRKRELRRPTSAPADRLIKWDLFSRART